MQNKQKKTPAPFTRATPRNRFVFPLRYSGRMATASHVRNSLPAPPPCAHKKTLGMHGARHVSGVVGTSVPAGLFVPALTARRRPVRAAYGLSSSALWPLSCSHCLGSRLPITALQRARMDARVIANHDVGGRLCTRLHCKWTVDRGRRKSFCTFVLRNEHAECTTRAGRMVDGG